MFGKSLLSIILYQKEVMLEIMTDEECLEEVTIIVFPPLPGVGIVEEDPIYIEEEACGDSASSQFSTPPSDSSDEIVIQLGISNPMQKINQLLDRAKDKYQDSICVKIASYETKEEMEEAREWLNAALRGSGNPNVLDQQAFSAFLGSSAPIFSINNRLSFVGLLPNESQLLARIGASLRIAKGT